MDNQHGAAAMAETEELAYLVRRSPKMGTESLWV